MPSSVPSRLLGRCDTVAGHCSRRASRGKNVECSPQIIYDIGTKILYFQCFVTTDMFLFCKPIFFSGICRIFRDLAFRSIKTRFQGFWDILCESLPASLDSQVPFLLDFAPGPGPTLGLGWGQQKTVRKTKKGKRQAKEQGS